MYTIHTPIFMRNTLKHSFVIGPFQVFVDTTTASLSIYNFGWYFHVAIDFWTPFSTTSFLLPP